MMFRLRLNELNLPVGLGLNILDKYLSESDLEDLIAEYSEKPRRMRRIILPSRFCLRKCYFHATWKRVITGKCTWVDVKKNYQQVFGSLKLAKANKYEVQNFYKQREREIMRERV